MKLSKYENSKKKPRNLKVAINEKSDILKNTKTENIENIIISKNTIPQISKSKKLKISKHEIIKK